MERGDPYAVSSVSRQAPVAFRNSEAMGPRVRGDDTECMARASVPPCLKQSLYRRDRLSRRRRALDAGDDDDLACSDRSDEARVGGDEDADQRHLVGRSEMQKPGVDADDER